ncbi:MAG: tetratricopeptide repeat protein [Gemmatimonadales bacterium]|nr:tetratricopeptide repeat protein [Gemmatimonadales bacterium]
MNGRAGLALIVAAALAGGCATKGQVRFLEMEVRTMRVETARRDSIRAAALAAVLTLQQRIMDSVIAGRDALRNLELKVSTDITEIHRQLLQVQELTGQSQRRLTDLKGQLDRRDEQNAAAGLNRPPATPGDSTGTAAPPPASPSVSADQMYQGARGNLLRGAVGTARRGFQELLRVYPTSELAADATLGIGESFVVEAPDSAVAYYARVVAQYPKSLKASTALFRLGRLEETRSNSAAARTYYDRLLKEYPGSQEAEVARERLKNLRP